MVQLTFHLGQLPLKLVQVGEASGSCRYWPTLNSIKMGGVGASPETVVLGTLPLAPSLPILALQGQLHPHLPLPFCVDLLSLILGSLVPLEKKIKVG